MLHALSFARLFVALLVAFMLDSLPFLSKGLLLRSVPVRLADHTRIAHFLVFMVIVPLLTLTPFFCDVSISFAVLILDLSRDPISILLLSIGQFSWIVRGGVRIFVVSASFVLELIE